MAGKLPLSLRCGVHLSIAGGPDVLFAEADRLGIDCFQIFLGSPRVWAVKVPADDVAARFRDRLGRYDFVNCHAPYLLNFATADGNLRERSLERAVKDMSIMARLGIKYYVVHPGTCADGKAGIARVRQAISAVLSREEKGVLVIENTAGERNDIAVSVEEIAAIVDGFGERVGVCLDTCHLFAAGVDLLTASGVANLADSLSSAGVAGRVVLMHANDSLAPCGGRRDRHAHIGGGQIGEKGFSHLLAHPLFRRLPWILETPKEDDMDPVNLAALRRLFARKKV